MIRAKIKLHQFVFLRESTIEPGDGATIIAWEGGDTPRWWWVYAPRVDGVEYYPPQPEHRIVDPLSIAVGHRSKDYAGIIQAHKRMRLTAQPVKLLAALEKAKSRQPRVIKRRWRPIIWIRITTRCWRLWRSLRDAKSLTHRVREWGPSWSTKRD